MSDQGIRCLLVEDNPDDVALFLDCAEQDDATWECCVAGTRADAIAILDTEDFDLVLLDLFLPDSAGLNTFKSLSRVARIPIVVWTGLDDEALAIKALRLGAATFLRKNQLSVLDLAGLVRQLAGARLMIGRLPGWKALSRREQETMLMVIQGFAQEQIANALGLSKGTIDSYCKRALAKLGFKSVQAFMQRGLGIVFGVSSNA